MALLPRSGGTVPCQYNYQASVEPPKILVQATDYKLYTINHMLKLGSTMKQEKSQHVEIVMPVYNGGIWLDEMMNSLIVQDYDDWSLIVRNDGSTDNTDALLQRWKARLGRRVTILSNFENENIGINLSFSSLLEATSSRYVMRADCDDVWFPSKVRASLDAIVKLEEKFGRDHPILVHTDMTLIDMRNEVISTSAWKHMKIRPHRCRTLNRLLFENVVSGAASIINRPLVNLVTPIPVEANTDDWWLALVAAAFGEISCINLQTMGYRRHDRNDTKKVNLANKNIGGKSNRFEYMRSFLRAIKSPTAMRNRIYELLNERSETIDIFLQRYHSHLDQKSFLTLSAYLNLRKLKFIQRKISVIRYGLWFPYTFINIGYLFLV